MEKAMGLISSLFNVASSQDVPFCQLQHAQWTYLCVSVLSAGNLSCWFDSMIWLPTGFDMLIFCTSEQPECIAEKFFALLFIWNSAKLEHSYTNCNNHFTLQFVIGMHSDASFFLVIWWLHVDSAIIIVLQETSRSKNYEFETRKVQKKAGKQGNTVAKRLWNKRGCQCFADIY